MVDVKIESVRSRTEITPEGTFREYYEVEFFIDDARHRLRMSPEGWTAKAAEEAVKKVAAELVAVRGKKVVI